MSNGYPVDFVNNANEVSLKNGVHEMHFRCLKNLLMVKPNFLSE